MTRLVQKKKIFSLHCVQGGEKDGRKKSEWFQETSSVEYIIGSSRKEHLFDDWPKESRESNSHFSYEIIFSVDPVSNTQNDRLVTFGNDVSDHSRVPTTKQPAFMMFGVIASNREKMPPIWFERKNTPTSAIYKKKSFGDESSFMRQEVH